MAKIFQRVSIPWRVRFLPLLSYLLGSALLSPSAHGQTLQQGLTEAIAYFTGGNYAAAFESLKNLESTFGREPEYLADDTQLLLLPMRGYAALAAGFPEEAIPPFDRFLEKFPDARQAQLVLYAKARAHRQIGQLAEAAEAFGRFADRYPQLSEGALARMQRIDILYELGDVEKAEAESEAFYASNAGPTLRLEVRLRMLQQATGRSDYETALRLLLETPWRVDTMPELAILAFQALSLGDLLLETERYADAIRAYRLVPPRFQLLQKQIELVQQVRQTAARETGRGGAAGGIWTDYFRNLIARQEAQLEALRSMEDYTGGFLLRLGQAYLMIGRHREAWLVFRSLSEDETQETKLREQAHYRWILTAYQRGDYEEALEIASLFSDRYPHSDLAPQATFMVARTYQELQRFEDGIPVLTDLLTRFPEHPSFGEWLYTRGFNLSMMSAYREARADFAAYRERFPEGPFRFLAQFWHAMTHHFERNNAVALQELDALLPLVSQQTLLPEVMYRRSNVLYAMRQFDEAEEAVDEFLIRFPRHLRAPEARVLLGDIRMGQGRLEEAADLFARITPEADSLFFYAVFQTGKILRALEDYAGMVEHFTAFVEREDVPQPQRISEGLYWIGWALAQSDQPEKAFPVFLEALERYANDPEATEIQGILTALGNLHRRYQGALRADHPDQPILQAENFNDWVESERLRLLEARKPTAFSRYSLFLSRYFRGRGETEASRGLILEVATRVPRSRLDAEVLADIGIALLDLNLTPALRYFDEILERFPRHYERAAAFFGQAHFLAEAGLYDEARAWLGRFRSQTPLHPLMFRATLLQGRVETELGLYEEATETFESLLQLRQARGRPHAAALAGLARLNERTGRQDRAIPYWQRIYTLYRTHTDLVFEAYVESARLFEERGDIEAAFRSLEEMVRDGRLHGEVGFSRARENLERLRGLREREGHGDETGWEPNAGGLSE